MFYLDLDKKHKKISYIPIDKMAKYYLAVVFVLAFVAVITAAQESENLDNMEQKDMKSAETVSAFG